VFNNQYPKIGEVYQIKFDGYGSVQQGWRPGIIIQNNIGNKHSPNVIAIPLTSRYKSTHLPTHVLIPAKETGLKLSSLALCENPETVSKEMIGNYITTIPKEYMSKIAEAIMISIPLISFLKPDEVHNVWYKTSELVLG
jgi:mRNA interferase MazF